MSPTIFANPDLPPAPELRDSEAHAPPPRRRARTSPAAPPFPKLVREQRDSAAGCRERAAADLLEAASLATVNARQRMESSAARWTVRAELLDRLEASVAARQAGAAAADPEEAGKLRS